MDSDKTLILMLMITLLTVIIVLIVFFLVFRFLRLSSTGLTALTNRFPVNEPPEGDTFSRQTIHIDGLYYRNCVRIIIAPDGLYISISIPFPWSQGESMMIPWDMISREGEGRIFLWNATRLKITGEIPIFISMPAHIGKVLRIT